MFAFCQSAAGSSGSGRLILWIDAQLSPRLASWITEGFGLEAYHIRDLGLLRASDRAIYQAARDAGAVIITKDSDFMELLQQSGPPPQVLWITCGNTSNARLKDIFVKTLTTAFQLLERGQFLVEISDDQR